MTTKTPRRGARRSRGRVLTHVAFSLTALRAPDYKENKMQMPSAPVHFVVSMLKSAEDYRACYSAHEQAEATLATIPYNSHKRSVAWERADAERTIALSNLALAQITLLRVAREGQ